MNGVFDGFLSPVFTLCDTGTHNGLAAVFHHGLDILEVDVDITGNGDDFGDATCSSGQHVVGFLEGFGELHVAVLVAQLVGTDEDESVDAFLQFLDACQSLQLATTAFSFHGHGYDAHGEDAFVLSQFGDHGRSTRTRSTAHTSGDKQHLGVVVQKGFNLVAAHLGGLATDVGVVAGTQFALAEVDRRLDLALQEGLIVGVAKDKVNALNAFFHHVVDGVAATTSHADDFDVVWLFHSNGLEHLVLRVDVCVIFCHNLLFFRVIRCCLE